MRGLQSKQSSYNYTLQRSSQQKALEDRPSSTGASRIAKQQPPQSLAKHGSLALISATAILAGLVYFAASKSAVVSKGSGPANSFVPSGVAEMQALFGIDQPIVVIEGRSSLAGGSLQGASSGYEGLGIITASSPKARVYGVGL